jgi:hypothetical protein
VMGPKNRALITTTEQQWPHPTSFVPNAGPSGISWFRSHVGKGRQCREQRRLLERAVIPVVAYCTKSDR